MRGVLLGALAMAGAAITVTIVLAGPLDPPSGPVAPTGRTLAEIEPRTPITPSTTPGDGDSSFRIAQSGSYYLTGNISGDASKKGIEIFLGPGMQVTIDLNGFTLNGTGATSAQPAIYVDGADATVVVRNGKIRSWRGAVQHFIGGRIVVEDVHAYACMANSFDLRSAIVNRCTAEDGIGAGFFIDGGSLTECQASGMSGNGFTINNASVTCRGCIAIGNNAAGFNLGQGVADSCRAEGNAQSGFLNPGVITNCTALSNSGAGIQCSFAATVRGCTAVQNDLEGIRVSGSSRVEGNTTASNGQYGIRATSSRNTIIGNTVSSNARATGAFGGILVAGNDNSIDSNHVTELLLGGDDVGIVVTGTSNLIVRNQLSAVSTYLSIGAGNTSGGASTTPSTAGAWVNITY